MGTGEGRRWALLVVGTAVGTVVLALLRLPSPALFAGLVVATALALAGRRTRRRPPPRDDARPGRDRRRHRRARPAFDAHRPRRGLAARPADHGGDARGQHGRGPAPGPAPRRHPADRDARADGGRRVGAGGGQPRPRRRRPRGRGGAVPARRDRHRDHAADRGAGLRRDGGRRGAPPRPAARARVARLPGRLHRRRARPRPAGPGARGRAARPDGRRHRAHRQRPVVGRGAAGRRRGARLRRDRLAGRGAVHPRQPAHGDHGAAVGLRCSSSRSSRPAPGWGCCCPRRPARRCWRATSPPRRAASTPCWPPRSPRAAT